MEEQKLRIVVLGLSGSGVTSFIKSIDETGHLSVSPSLTYVPPPNSISIDFGQCLIGKSLRLHLFGLDDWTMFFTLEDLRPFLEGVHGYIVMIDSADPATLPNIQPILDKVRSFKEIPHTLIANKQNMRNALITSQLRDMLHLESDEPLIPCAVIDSRDAKSALLSVLIKLPEAASSQTIDDLAKQSA